MGNKVLLDTKRALTYVCHPSAVKNTVPKANIPAYKLYRIPIMPVTSHHRPGIFMMDTIQCKMLSAASS